MTKRIESARRQESRWSEVRAEGEEAFREKERWREEQAHAVEELRRAASRRRAEHMRELERRR